MKKIIVSFTALALFWLSLQSCSKQEKTSSGPQAKPEYNLGCELLTPTEYQALPKFKMPAVTKILATAAVVSPIPPVGNQGGEGSCVAFGTTYAARSADWAINNSLSTFSYSTDIFSPEYVYNQIKVGSCSSGAYVYKGLDLLKKQGVCRWSLMPYTDLNCNTKPNNAQKADAANYKITSYGTVAINVTSIKTLLAANKPVIVAGPVDNAFVNLGNGSVLGNRNGSLGGHCYYLVGYDDSYGGGSFKFMNSWGSTWASSGFGYISYASIGTWWTEAYSVTTN